MASEPNQAQSMLSSELPSTGNSQKRTRDYDPSSSPELPVFSSDDIHGAGVEDQSHARPKRQYRGRWWEPDSTIESDQLKSATRRRFRRAADSDVNVESDEQHSPEGGVVDGVEDNGPDTEELHENGIVDDAEDNDDIEDPESAEQELIEEWANRKPVDWESLESEEAKAEGLPSRNWYERNLSQDEPVNPLFLAKVIIFRCVDNGNEDIDLSDLDLEHLPDDVIAPLGHMVKMFGAVEEFSSLVPGLKLFLSCNLLQTVPMEIFFLKNLTVLSLRNNKLTKIPSAIGRLHNLCELNLGGNELRSLPFEILKLITDHRLKVFNVQPNPFVDPPRRGADLENEYTEALLLLNAEQDSAAKMAARASGKCVGWGPTRHAVSPVTYFNIDGSRRSTRLGIDQSTEQQGQDTANNSTRLPPSLLELALRACYMHRSPSQLFALLPADSPPNLTRVLQEAENARAEGGRVCSVCGEHYVLARTEYMEWWYCIAPTDYAHLVNLEEFLRSRVLTSHPVPFLRRGCSWGCSPNDNQPVRLWISHNNSVAGVLEGRREIGTRSLEGTH